MCQFTLIFLLLLWTLLLSLLCPFLYFYLISESLSSLGLSPQFSAFLSSHYPFKISSQGFKNTHTLTTWQHVCGFLLILKSFNWWVQHLTPKILEQQGNGREIKAESDKITSKQSNWQNSLWSMRFGIPRSCFPPGIMPIETLYSHTDWTPHGGTLSSGCLGM